MHNLFPGLSWDGSYWYNQSGICIGIFVTGMRHCGKIQSLNRPPLACLFYNPKHLLSFHVLVLRRRSKSALTPAMVEQAELCVTDCPRLTCCQWPVFGAQVTVNVEMRSRQYIKKTPVLSDEPLHKCIYYQDQAEARALRMLYHVAGPTSI